MFTSASSSTLNSYGYSPHPLSAYIEWVYTLLTSPTPAGDLPSKPILLSITSSDVGELQEMVSAVQALRQRLKTSAVNPLCDPSHLIAVELNTSCPNIKDAPPPSYDFPSLVPFLEVLASTFFADPTLTVGLKLPPYLYATCFQDVIATIASFSRPQQGEDPFSSINPIAFLTCTNTLGSCLLFSEQVTSECSSVIFPLLTPLGGLGGDAIHSVALGNVYTFSQLLAQQPDSALRNIVIIGVGGVTSSAAFNRMIKAGAKVIGCATLLGKYGVAGFSKLV